jgi:hypothetical protein
VRSKDINKDVLQENKKRDLLYGHAKIIDVTNGNNTVVAEECIPSFNGRSFNE